MDYYVKELSNNTVSLVAADGHALASFATVAQAVKVCTEACLVQPLFVERHHSYLQTRPGDFESSFLAVEH